jgi:hypothetical protein
VQAEVEATTTDWGARASPRGLPVVESAVVVALVATVAVGVENPKPEAGVGVAVGTANSRMLPLEAPVDCATNA